MTNKFSRFTALMALSLSVLFFSSFQIQAKVGDTFAIGDLKYTVLTEEGSTGTVEVKKNEDISGSITIPDSVENNGVTYSVTSIGKSAFSECSSLTSITIPASVTSIGMSMFSRCFNLISVIFKGNAPSKTPTGGTTGIFNDLCVTVYYYEGTSGWTHTWEGALTQMIELPKVGDCFTDDDFQYRILSIDGATGTVSAEKQFYTIPSGDVPIPATVENSGVTYQVTEIGAHAFDTCYDLTHITIPDSVTVIGAYAFASCFSLSSVSMGNGVKEIGYWAFNRCLALKEIGIPDGVESIKPAAFSDCWSLEKVYFQGDAPELGRDAFWNTEATIYYKEGTKGWTNPWGGRPTVVIGEEKPVLSYSLDGEDMVLKWEEKADMTLQVLDEKTDNYLDIKENIHTKDGVCTYRAPMKGVKAFYRLMEK